MLDNLINIEFEREPGSKTYWNGKSLLWLPVLLVCVCLWMTACSGKSLPECFDQKDCGTKQNCLKDGTCLNVDGEKHPDVKLPMKAPSEILCKEEGSSKLYGMLGRTWSYAISKNLPLFVTLDEKNVLYLWDLKEMRILSWKRLNGTVKWFQADHRILFHPTRPFVLIPIVASESLIFQWVRIGLSKGAQSGYTFQETFEGKVRTILSSKSPFSLSFDPKGQFVVYLGGHGLTIWRLPEKITGETDDPKHIHQVLHQKIPNLKAQGLLVLPNGEQILSIEGERNRLWKLHYQENKVKEEVVLQELKSEKRLFSAHEVAIHPSGTSFAVSSESSQIVLYKLPSLQKLKSIQIPRSKNSFDAHTRHMLVYGQQGKMLFSSSILANELNVWDLSNDVKGIPRGTRVLQEQLFYGAPGRKIPMLIEPRSGDLFLMGPSLYRWRLTKNKSLQEIWFLKSYTHFLIHPHQKIAVALLNPRVSSIPSKGPFKIKSGLALLSGTDGRLLAYEKSDGTPENRFKSIHLSPSGRFLLSLQADFRGNDEQEVQTVRLWRIIKGEKGFKLALVQTFKRNIFAVTGWIKTKQGERLLVNEQLTTESTPALKIYDVKVDQKGQPALQQVRVLDAKWDKMPGVEQKVFFPFYGSSWSPDGQFLAAGYSAALQTKERDTKKFGQAHLWKMENPYTTKPVLQHAQSIENKIKDKSLYALSGQFSPDNRWFLEHFAHYFRLWDLSKTPVKPTLIDKSAFQPWSYLAGMGGFYPGGRYYATISVNETRLQTQIHLWDLSKPEGTKSLIGGLSDANVESAEVGFNYDPKSRKVSLLFFSTAQAKLWGCN